jgi:hypothetical protein
MCTSEKKREIGIAITIEDASVMAAKRCSRKL